MSDLRPSAPESMQSSRLDLRWLPLLWCPPLLAQILLGQFGAPIMTVVAHWGLGWGDLSDAIVVIGFALVIALLVRVNTGDTWEVLGLRGSAPWQAYALSLAGLLLLFFAYPVVNYAVAQIGLPMFWYSNAGIPAATTLIGLTARIILSALLIPVGEEILFRGYCQGALRRLGVPPMLAIIGSSLVFASAHIFVGPGLVLYIFLWGMIPGYLYHRYGHLGPVIALHAVNNLLAYVILPLVFN